MNRNRLDDFIKFGKGAPGVESPNKKIRDISRLVVVNSDKFSVSSSIEQVCSHRVQGFQGSSDPPQNRRIKLLKNYKELNP